MWYGHGLTGIVLIDNATKWWALSLHPCSHLVCDLTTMRDDLSEDPTHHKEESKARIQADISDRMKLRERINQCIDPLDPADHSITLFNIVSGKLVAESANVQSGLQIGKDCMRAYENKLPQHFYNKISIPVVTMDTTRKWINLGAPTTVDTEVIFNRTLGIIGSGECDLHDLFSHSRKTWLDSACWLCCTLDHQLADIWHAPGSGECCSSICTCKTDEQWCTSHLRQILRLQHKRVHSWSKSIHYCWPLLSS